jgi:uncharacterized membrane protein YoaK (UPF0700 family)
MPGGRNGATSAATDRVEPPKDDRDASLRPLLLVLTVVTGLVDAVSYLELGHVFVANMTGNVGAMFLGAAVGAFLVFHKGVGAVLALTLTLLGLNAIAAYCVGSRSVPRPG